MRTATRHACIPADRHFGLLWNIVLTPNDNPAHDDHHHVDLTLGAEFLDATGGFLGPATHADCGGPSFAEGPRR